MAYRLLGGILAFIVGVFHVALMLALCFGLYVGYVQPTNNQDPGARIADSAIHSGKESIGVVERVGHWVTAEANSDSIAKPTQKVARVGAAVVKVFVYYPAWAGAGTGGAVGGVFGDLAWHIMHHNGSAPTNAEPAESRNNNPIDS
jgi:hypothetical protein